MAETQASLVNLIDRIRAVQEVCRYKRQSRAIESLRR